MPRGTGIAKRGFGKALIDVSRARFDDGGSVNNEPVVVTPEEMDKLLNPPEMKVPRIPSDKEIKDVSKSVEDYKKKEKEEPKLQFRCPKSKDGLQFRCKKGGSVKSGLKNGGKALKPVDKENNPGLAKLPTEVRNKMGYMKDGGSAKPGLWANINRRKKLGISRPKSKTTISKKAYANMKAGFPKK